MFCLSSGNVNGREDLTKLHWIFGETPSNARGVREEVRHFDEFPNVQIHMESAHTGAMRGTAARWFQLFRGITGKEFTYGGSYRHHAAID